MRNEVRSLRGERELSQQQLGEAMGVSRQTINSIEKERYTPSLPKSITSSRWWMPLFSLLLGAIMFTAFAIAGVAYIIALVVIRPRS